MNLSDLFAQLESLQLAAEYEVGFVNARGAVPIVRLYDIPNRVREVALHGVRCGTAIALAAAQVRSGYNLWLLPYGFPVAYHLKDYEALIEDFKDAMNNIAFISSAEDIVKKVFFSP